MNPENGKGPDPVAAESRPESKPLVGGGDLMNAVADTGALDKPELRRLLVEAASAALPIGELEVQAMGGRSPWNTRTRPGRIAGRERALRLLVRAAEVALADTPDIHPRDVAAALRSLALRASDLLVCSASGAWLSSPAAVKHRGREIAAALVELSRIIRHVKEETR